MSTRKSHFRTFRSAYRLWNDNLTLTGKSMVAVCLLCLPSGFTLNSGLLQLFSALVMLLLATGIVSFVFRPRLHVVLRAPDSVMCDESFDAEVRVTNRGRLPVFDMGLSIRPGPNGLMCQDEEQMDSVEAGRTTTRRLAMKATRRGVHSWPELVVASTFPFRLFRRRRIVTLENELIVFPKYRRLASLELPDTGFGGVGEQFDVAPKVSDSGEFFGNREYQPGMVVRRWDYSRWARLGRPVVREYHELLKNGVVLFVDTLPAEAGSGDMESALSLAAAIIHELHSMSRPVDHLILGSTIISPQQGDRQREQLMYELAAATSSRDDAFAELMSDLERVSLTGCCGIVIVRAWDERRESVWRTIATNSAAAKRIQLNPDETSAAPATESTLELTHQQLEVEAVQI